MILKIMVWKSSMQMKTQKTEFQDEIIMIFIFLNFGHSVR